MVAKKLYKGKRMIPELRHSIWNKWVRVCVAKSCIWHLKLVFLLRFSFLSV